MEIDNNELKIHIEEFKEIPKYVRRDICNSYRECYKAINNVCGSIVQVSKELSVPRHDVIATLILDDKFPIDLYERNHPNDEEGAIGNKIACKIKVDIEHARKNKIPVEKSTGKVAGLFDFDSNDKNGPIVNHTNLDLEWTKILVCYVLYNRQYVAFDPLAHRLDMEPSELKAKFKTLEQNLKLSSKNATDLKRDHNKNDTREKNNYPYNVTQSMFNPVYAKVLDGSIDKWDAMEVLLINDGRYKEFMGGFGQKYTIPGKKYHPNTYKEKWLKTFGGFEEYFIRYIKDESAADLALEISNKEFKADQDKRKEAGSYISEVYFRLKVCLYLKRLNLSEEYQRKVQEAFIKYHADTVWDGYVAAKAAEGDPVILDGEDTSVEESEETTDDTDREVIDSAIDNLRSSDNSSDDFREKTTEEAFKEQKAADDISDVISDDSRIHQVYKKNFSYKEMKGSKDIAISTKVFSKAVGLYKNQIKSDGEHIRKDSILYITIDVTNVDEVIYINALTKACVEEGVALMVCFYNLPTEPHAYQILVNNPNNEDPAAFDLFLKEDYGYLVGNETIDNIANSENLYSVLIWEYDKELKSVISRSRIVSTKESAIKDAFVDVIADVIKSDKKLSVVVCDSSIVNGAIVDGESHESFYNFRLR